MGKLNFFKEEIKGLEKIIILIIILLIIINIIIQGFKLYLNIEVNKLSMFLNNKTNLEKIKEIKKKEEEIESYKFNLDKLSYISENELEDNNIIILKIIEALFNKNFTFSKLDFEIDNQEIYLFGVTNNFNMLIDYIYYLETGIKDIKINLNKVEKSYYEDFFEFEIQIGEKYE